MAKVQVSQVVVCDQCEFICRSHIGPDTLHAEVCALAHNTHCPNSKQLHDAAIQELILRVQLSTPKVQVLPKVYR